MDEGSGNRLLDSSGNGNDATFVSSSSGVTWVQGQNNLAVRTNGALNRYAAVPHNAGDVDMPMRLGQSIIFDIFPQVASNYFHDLTRTWSLGYATDEVQEAWDQTKEIFDQVMGSLALGVPCRDYQIKTCEYYASKGHPTPMSAPGSHEGYVHGLGHGIGLDIHEGPSLSHAAGNDTVLQPGHVFSVEPGLYYPARGFGVRIEDSVAFLESGELIIRESGKPDTDECRALSTSLYSRWLPQ